LPFSYLGKGLLLHILNTLFQSNDLGGQGVDNLVMFLPTGTKRLDLLMLTLHLPNKVVNHIGQLIYLDILRVDAAVQFINHSTYLIGHIPNEIDMFFQMIDRVILLMIDVPQVSRILPSGHVFGPLLSPFCSSSCNIQVTLQENNKNIL
jgi:hypothetical protein